MAEAFATLGANLAGSLERLLWMALAFGVLAFIVKRGRAVAAARKSAGETRVNLVYFLMDAAVVAPAMFVVVKATRAACDAVGLVAVDAAFWGSVPQWLVLLLAIAVADLAGYWRHRLMHQSVLWPVHAIHHSDREMTWLTLTRFHPINRLITAVVGMAALVILGFPAWAIVLNGRVRNWYGHFLHADLPLTYGTALGRVFVSPVMHRWHHTRDKAQSGRNFATIFAFYDVVFGTWYCPHREVGALGVEDRGFPDSWAGQIAWPFIVWWRNRSEPALAAD